jgi:arsenite/tail-anchored protein-transporting ATPase
VGKTTHAAMAAIDAASRRRTLLITTDPASSLSAVLDVPVGSTPAAVAGARQLRAANVDARRGFERWLSDRRDLLATIAVRGTYLDDEDVSRLLTLSLPGIDEVIGLLEVVRVAAGHDEDEPFEEVIVDTAPTGHTLRLLAAPALLARASSLLDALHSHHRVVVSALRGSYRADAADGLIQDLERDAASLTALLRDRERTRLTWVTLPEPMAMEETSDAIAALENAGIAVTRLIVNRVTPAPPSHCTWCISRRAFESRAVAPVARRFGRRELVAFPERQHEPRGVAALRAAAKELRPWETPPKLQPPTRKIRASLDLRPEGRSYLKFDIHGTAGPGLLLFGGKGGVGKSTCAAATALDLSRTRRVLLLSTDPAHSLGDVFGTRFDNVPRPVPGGPPALKVREIDPAAEMERFRATYVSAVDDAFARIARTSSGDHAAFRDLIDLAPPGIDEVMAVAEVADTIAGGDSEYDVVVADTAPTGHALRLLQTPAVLRDWALALMAILLKYREIVGAGTLASLLVRLSKRVRALQDILADPARSRFVVVTRAAMVPVMESLELIQALEPIGMTVDAVIVNAVGRGACALCRAAAGDQRRALAALRDAVDGDGYAIIEAPAEIPPPHGARALSDWRSAWRQRT